VKLLLEKGADLNPNNRGHAPLLHAAGNGHDAIVQLLLATGQVEADSKESVCRMPLLYIASVTALDDNDVHLCPR
jgi:ankyrin repeat protein